MGNEWRPDPTYLLADVFGSLEPTPRPSHMHRILFFGIICANRLVSMWHNQLRPAPAHQTYLQVDLNSDSPPEPVCLLNGTEHVTLIPSPCAAVDIEGERKVSAVRVSTSNTLFNS